MMKRIHVRSNDPAKGNIILLVRAFVEDKGKGREKESDPAALSKIPEDENWLYKLFGYPRYTYR